MKQLFKEYKGAALVYAGLTAVFVIFIVLF